MILLGLDIGERRIGVAVSDPLGATAQPLETIARDERTGERISEIARDAGAERLVVGLPLLMNGTEGSQARLVRDFAATLAAAMDIPVDFVDERLTTRQADAVVRQGKVRRSEKKAASDRVAAALILRAYMDTLPEE